MWICKDRAQGAMASAFSASLPTPFCGAEIRAVARAVDRLAARW